MGEGTGHAMGEGRGHAMGEGRGHAMGEGGGVRVRGAGCGEGILRQPSDGQNVSQP